MCQRMEQDNALSTTQVEQVVKAAISYSEEGKARAYQNKGKWGLLYVFCLIIACLELLFSYWSGSITTGLMVSMGLGAVFGMYFCFFVKEKLPDYYDKNRICVYTDGLFEMHFPGLSFNNNNWRKILKAGRIWAVTMLLAYPVLSYVETLLITGIWRDIVDLFLALFVTLGGLFIPIYMVGKKYE